MNAITFAIQAMNAASAMVALGKDLATIRSHLKKSNDALVDMQRTGRNPTVDEWDALNAVSNELHSAIQHGG